MKKTLIVVLFLALSATTSTWAQSGKTQQFIVSEELIFAPQNQHAHGSSLVLLPNGDKLTAWFQGSGERKADDVRILGSRLKKGAKSWTAPFLMADTKNIPDCNPVLFLNNQNKLFLVWIAVQANRWESSILKYKTSTNYNTEGAPNWEWQDNILLKPDDRFAEEVNRKFDDLPENNVAWAEYAPQYDDQIKEASKDLLKRSIGWMTRIKPLILESGKIILPLYSDGLNFSLAAISEDDGETWRPSLPIVGRGPIQPALAQKSNGDIVALMRDSGNSPTRVHKSISKDQGESWSATVKTNIPNTASVELLKMKDGSWAFLGNPIEDGRYQLSLYLSDDEGETWKWKVNIEDSYKGAGSFSYPSLVQDPKGLLHMTYSYKKDQSGETIKHVVVDPKKIIK
ncbi:sialidase family protein [Reichenbachiella sp. MALMAid0571]|uniref:sialidase family protein n=1 Tax=Reichenbachiella sp. MALMAid0571 TaxID=3143939 RepID=UPI0032DF7B73